MTSNLATIIRDTEAQAETRLKFRTRLDEGQPTRTDNATSHFCVYFAAYDPDKTKVFIGLHRKSGLWLFNGGHMDPGETPAEAVSREATEEWGIGIAPDSLPDPGLLTLTEIEHPEVQICEWHYDIWYFLPFHADTFHPDGDRMGTEYLQWGWKSFEEASLAFGDVNSMEALDAIRSRKPDDR